MLLSLSGLCPYVTLCLISRCQSLCYPILALLMALAIVLRTLLPLHGQFTPPQTKLVSLRGVCLGCTTNNIAEYSVVIELLVDSISLIIHHLVVRIDS